MKETLYIALIGVFLIVTLDVVGSIVSRQFGFKYVYLAPLSFAIYIFISFLITRNTGWKTSLFIIAFLGIFDATIGWKLSMFFKANTEAKYEITIPNVLSMVIVTIIFGIIGSAIALKYAK
ncbi:MAG: hypothetical protein MUF58_12785 [Arcicella sp.]|jgi:hypothetical protein|nr:hypothetical protein [Arcicella sp.]